MVISMHVGGKETENFSPLSTYRKWKSEREYPFQLQYADENRIREANDLLTSLLL